MRKRLWSRKAVLIVSCLVAFGLVDRAAADEIGNDREPMTFTLLGSGGNCDACEWVSAIGIIDRDTPERFRAFLRTNGTIQWSVALHSPGGDVAGALELGREIRKARMNTTVEESFFPNPADPWADRRPGRCGGACAYAFLGGVSRGLAGGARLGFSPLSSTRGLGQTGAEIGLSEGQRLSGSLVAYFVDMNVDSRLLTVTADAAPDQTVYPSVQDLKTLGVLTKTGFAPFAVEPVKTGAVASSRNLDESSPVHRVQFYCRAPTRQPYVALHVDSYKDRPTSNTFTPAEFLKQIGGAKVESDKGNAILDATGMDVVLSGADYILSIPLSKAALTSLKSASKVMVSTDAAHFFYNFGPSAAMMLSASDRQAIALAFRNCI